MHSSTITDDTNSAEIDRLVEYGTHSTLAHPTSTIDPLATSRHIIPNLHQAASTHDELGAKYVQQVRRSTCSSPAQPLPTRVAWPCISNRHQSDTKNEHGSLPLLIRTRLTLTVFPDKFLLASSLESYPDAPML